MLGAIAGAATGGTSTSSDSGASGRVDFSNTVTQGNISFGGGGIDDDAVMWIAIAALGLGAVYFFVNRRR